MTEMIQTFGDHYRSGSFAPYLRGIRIAGAAGEVVEAQQPAGDLSDPPVSSLVLTQVVSRGVAATCDMGAGRFRTSAGRGSLFLIPPAVATTFLIDNQHTIRVLAVDAPWVRPHLAQARGMRDPFDFGRLHSCPFEKPCIARAMDALWAECSGTDCATRLHAEGLVLAMMGLLLREAERPIAPVRAGLAPWQVRRVIDYLEVHLAEDVGLDELAALVGLSEFHFCTAFRRSTGLPPHRWLTARRMEKAKTLIDGGRLSLTEIALAVGYGSQSAFGAAFRRSTGITPTAWRRTQGDPAH